MLFIPAIDTKRYSSSTKINAIKAYYILIMKYAFVAIKVRAIKKLSIS